MPDLRSNHPIESDVIELDWIGLDWIGLNHQWDRSESWSESESDEYAGLIRSITIVTRSRGNHTQMTCKWGGRWLIVIGTRQKWTRHKFPRISHFSTPPPSLPPSLLLLPRLTSSSHYAKPQSIMQIAGVLPRITHLHTALLSFNQ